MNKRDFELQNRVEKAFDAFTVACFKGVKASGMKILPMGYWEYPAKKIWEEIEELCHK
jgi:hypothetical protein